MRFLPIFIAILLLTAPNVIAESPVYPQVIHNTLKRPIRPVVSSFFGYDEIAQLIAERAVASHVDPHMALYIADRESSLVPTAQGDFSTTTQEYTSFGIWQIHLTAHTDITLEQATDPVWSTEWAINQLAQGNCKIWTTCPLKVE